MKLKDENNDLMTKLKETQTLLQSVSTRSTTESSSTPQSDSDLQQEINFLNTVISDLVLKNQELQLKNDIFMQGGVDTMGLK